MAGAKMIIKMMSEYAGDGMIVKMVENDPVGMSVVGVEAESEKCLAAVILCDPDM